MSLPKTVRLGEVVTVSPRIQKGHGLTDNQDVGFLAMADVSEEGHIFQVQQRSFKDVNKGYTPFQNGDVLLAKITPCFENGKATVVSGLPSEWGFGSTEFHVLRPSKLIDGRYLFHLVWNERFRINGSKNMTGSAGQKRVPTSFIDALEVELPPIEKQKRIAAILDKVDSIRRKRREALTQADDFLRAAFLEMFGDPVLNDMDWPVAALDTVAEVRSGATKGRNLQDKPTTTLPYMRVANVQDGRLALDDIQEIEVLTSEVNKYSLQAGDLLLTEGGDPDKLGRGAVWNAELPQCLHQNHIFAVRASTARMLPEFLSAQISSLRGKRYFLKVGKQTTGIATINKTVLSQYPALVPPLAAQQKYVEVTAKIRCYKESLQTALQASEELFSASSAKLLSA